MVHMPTPRLKSMPKSLSLLYLVAIREPLISLGLPLHHATAVALLVSSRFASSWFLSHWWCCTCLQFHHAVLYFLWICDGTICISPRGRLKNRSITLEVLAMILNLVPSFLPPCNNVIANVRKLFVDAISAAGNLLKCVLSQGNNSYVFRRPQILTEPCSSKLLAICTMKIQGFFRIQELWTREYSL
jgi:hypothetical protein